VTPNFLPIRLTGNNCEGDVLKEIYKLTMEQKRRPRLDGHTHTLERGKGKGGKRRDAEEYRKLYKKRSATGLGGLFGKMDNP